MLRKELQNFVARFQRSKMSTYHAWKARGLRPRGQENALEAAALALVALELLLGRAARPLLEPVGPRLLLLDHEVVLRASLFTIGLAAGVRLQLELFSVQDLARLALFDGRPSLNRFWNNVGT